MGADRINFVPTAVVVGANRVGDVLGAVVADKVKVGLGGAVIGETDSVVRLVV